VDVPIQADAQLPGDGDNVLVSAAPHDPVEEAADLLARAAAAARRILAGPDGPLALALVLGLVAMAEVTIYAEEVGYAMVANLLATLPLALLRRHLAWAAGLAVFGVILAVSDETSTLTVAGLCGLVIALYFFAARHRRRWSVLLAFPFLVSAVTPFSGESASFAGVLLLVVVVGALALGDSRRQRGQAIAERDETRKAMVDSLHDQAVMGERARIARDLHDAAGHAINVIAVRAGTARLRQDPERSQAALEAIEELARKTVAEIDQIVGTLRERGSGTGAVDSPPGLASLDTLVARHAAAGLDVSVASEGEPRRLESVVDQAAYRILQEALTNAARHGAGAARVELAFGEAALELTISNAASGENASRANGGHGLVGMRERATLLGGSLHVERANGSFHVRARLPYGGPRA
jgi:signal transduction histidine kinase